MRRPPTWFAVAAALLVGGSVAIGVGHRRWKANRDSAAIRSEHATIFDALPPAPPTPCPESEVHRRRFAAVATFLQRSRPRETFDAPLPAPLLEQLRQLDLTGRSGDCVCILHELEVSSDSFAALGSLAALFFDKADFLLAAGDATGGWSLVAEGLELYARPVSFQYIHYFSAFNFLRRATRLVADSPPAAAWRPRLVTAAQTATMTRTDFCAGLREELVALATVYFYDHLSGARSALVARWGEAPIAVFAAAGLGSHQLSTWRRFDAVARPLRERCDADSPARLERDARAALAALAREDAALGAVLAATVQRIDDFGQLEAAGRDLIDALTRDP